MTATPAPDGRALAAGGAGWTGRPAGAEVNAREQLVELFRDLQTSPNGSAARRLVVYGPNGLTRRTGRRWLGESAAGLP